MSLLSLVAHSQAWLTHQCRQLPRRSDRGNNSIEMAIIVGAVIVVATLIGLAIKAAVESRLAGLK